jgi:hypothetical protein
MEAFRCIHASRLSLDVQLHGFQLPGAPQRAGRLREVIEEATLTSFEQIIDACLESEVDCLLISGECFDPHDRGLRGPAALVRGCKRLAEHEIPVVIQSNVGRWSNWPAGLRLPQSAHLLGNGKEASVVVARGGKLVATISEADFAAHPQTAGRGWQIVFPDTTGSESAAHSITFQVFDKPEPAQGLRPDEIGSRGCALLEFDDRGNRSERFLATAPVRWEKFDIAISTATTRDDLLQEMAAVLEQTGREPCERVWLVAWELSGEGPLLESLADQPGRQELCAELAGLDPVPKVLVHSYSLRVRRPVLARDSITDRDELAVEYAARLAAWPGPRQADLRESLAESALRGGPWEVKLESLFAELDAGEIAHDAARMAMHWFAAHEELSS